VGLCAGSASKQVRSRACSGAGRPSGRGGACLATPTAVQICISVSWCQGGAPVIMCNRVAAKPQMSTLLVARQPGANCSGALQQSSPQEMGRWVHTANTKHCKSYSGLAGIRTWPVQGFFV